MASISFRGEAAESFANILQEFTGWTVEVTPESGAEQEGLGDEPFDAVLLGSAADEADDYFAVRVQRWDDEAGEGVGKPFIVIADELKVY